MLKRLFRFIEHQPITLSQWVASFLGILFVRFFFENLSSETFTGIMATDVATNVHYVLFYLAVALSLWLLLGGLLPIKRKVIGNVLLFGFLLVWLAPLLDLLISWGEGFGMAYLSQRPEHLFNSWLTFFGPLDLPGATPGIRIEIVLIVLLIAAYVWQSSKSFWKTAVGLVGGYAVMLLWGSLPSVIFAIATACGYVPTELTQVNAVALFFFQAIQDSAISLHVLHPTMLFNSPDRKYEFFFNIVLSQVYFVAIPILLASVMRWARPMWLKAVVKNARPERITHYVLLTLLGVGLAFGFDDVQLTWNWLNVLTLIVLLSSVACAWLYAVAQNDLADVKIDKKTNKNRPLITHAMNDEQMRKTSYAFLAWALLGAYLVSHYALFFVAVYVALSHIYSMPPLRLRRIPILSTFLIALAGLMVTMAGFYSFACDQGAEAFERSWALLILLIFTMAANVKDVKDREGDGADRVLTLPVLLGDRRGRLVIGLLLATSFLLVPALLSVSAIWIPTLIGAVLAVGLMLKEPFNEKWIFGLYFAYVIVVASMLLS